MARRTVSEDDIVRAAQAVVQDRKELLSLLSDVSDSVVTQDQAGGAVAHLAPSLVAEIHRRTLRCLGEDD